MNSNFVSRFILLWILSLNSNAVAVKVKKNIEEARTKPPAAVEKADSSKKSKAPLVVVGLIPGRYFTGVEKHKLVLGYIEVENRVIIKLEKLKPEALQSFREKNSNKNLLLAKRKDQNDFDIIYPGLINLHNHTKQNNLPIWGEAVGQFANRFEWRDWPNYKYTVSGNMNPWVDYARAVECATYRWSELQALTLGTTYLQGPSSCVDDFGIMRVEDANSVISGKAAVQAPTDLVMPVEMQFVWNTLRPEILKGKSYEQALAEVIQKHCHNIPVTKDNVNSDEILKILKDQEQLVEQCNKEGLPDKFIRYVYWIHPTIAGRKNYFLNNKKPYSAVIAHLAEGRRDDPYNQKEFELVKMMKLDFENMNFVHGVGIPASEFSYLAKKKIGLIWSPFSNLILYSQTLDVASAFNAGVRIALGSDWVPTGTKSVLEELKIARKYILKDYDQENILRALTANTNKLNILDEELYKMVTENPAQMIGHSEIARGNVSKANPSGVTESAIGTLTVGAMGTFIIVSKKSENPYTNLVAEATERDINLVIVDGKPIYGNKTYIEALGYGKDAEVLNIDSDAFASLADRPSSGPKEKTPEALFEHLKKTLNEFKDEKFPANDKCKFSEPKVLVASQSIEGDEDLKKFKETTGINLDKASDIAKLLAIQILTQNRNKIDPIEGKPSFSLKYFPALYSCNDERHASRLREFIKSGSEEDEFTRNRNYRNDYIKKNNLGRSPKALNDKYVQ